MTRIVVVVLTFLALSTAAKLGRVAARTLEARAKHVASRKRHAQAESA